MTHMTTIQQLSLKWNYHYSNKANSVVHQINMVHHTPFNIDQGVGVELDSKSFHHIWKMQLNTFWKCA